MKKRCTAIVLAGGSGKRMQAGVPKQYMLLDDKPLIWYALNAFEQSSIIDDVILVVSRGDSEHRQEAEKIVARSGFRKVDAVVEGGSERYLSVWEALKVIEGGGLKIPNRDGYVFIHDGARPFVNERIIRDTYEAVRSYGACAAAVPLKDTVKICDAEGFALQTPDRRTLWAVQTPQVFDVRLVIQAYRAMLETYGLNAQNTALTDAKEITDDAMVVETFGAARVKMVPGSYENIKITTPEDMKTARSFL